MMHLSETERALYGSGDMGPIDRLRLRAHLSRCEECRREVEAYRGQGAWLAGAARQLPEGVAWGRLAAEMRANIRLGLAAGECVATPVEERPRAGWRVAAALASAVMIFLSAMLMRVPPARSPTPGVRLEANTRGIELRENGRSMTLMHGAAGAVVSVSTEGSLRARYLDSETGQVTIHHVYAQ
jgi:hypothetical protein